MNLALTKEPVSSNIPEFRQIVRQHLEVGEPLVVLFRYANCGGSKDYFIVRNPNEFEQILNKSYPKISITVFFESNFKLKGQATDELCKKAIQLFNQEKITYDGIDIINLENEGTLLEDNFYFSGSQEILNHFTEIQGKYVLIGTLEFWKDNCDSIITVYVPDDDGIVRPGAY